jgi:hypothetical protein
MQVQIYENGQRALVGENGLLHGHFFPVAGWEIFANPLYRLAGYAKMPPVNKRYEHVPGTEVREPAPGLSPIVDIDKHDPGAPWWETFRNDLVITSIEKAPAELVTGFLVNSGQIGIQ